MLFLHLTHPYPHPSTNSNRGGAALFFPRELTDDTNTEIRHRLLSNLSLPNHIRGVEPPRRRNRAHNVRLSLPH